MMGSKWHVAKGYGVTGTSLLTYFIFQDPFLVQGKENKQGDAKLLQQRGNKYEKVS